MANHTPRNQPYSPAQVAVLEEWGAKRCECPAALVDDDRCLDKCPLAYACYPATDFPERITARMIATIKKYRKLAEEAPDYCEQIAITQHMIAEERNARTRAEGSLARARARNAELVGERTFEIRLQDLVRSIGVVRCKPAPWWQRALQWVRSVSGELRADWNL